MVVDRRLGRIPATLPARYASMVSEPLADKLVEADDDSGGGFRHRRSNLGTRGPIECDFKLQSDSRRSTVYDDNLGEAIDLRFDSFEEKMDHHHRELMDLLESLCRGNHTPTRSDWTIADEGAPPSSLSRTPAVRQKFQVSISNPTPANSRILRKGGGNNTVISTVSVGSYSPKEEENLLGNYDDLSDDYESDEDDFMEESDFEELAETLGGDTGVDKGDEVVFEGGVQRIANEEKQQIELSVIWNDDEEEYDFCNDDVEEVRIEKDVRRKAEEKKDKPKSVVLDEPCAVLDDVDDEDAVAIAQSPQGEPALGALDCVWGKSRCFSETPNLNPVLQQKSIVSIAMAIPRPKKTSRAQQPAESILRRLVSSTSKTNPILNLGQESNDSLNQRPIDYDIGWKLDPGSGAVKALQVTLLGEVFDSGGTIDNATAVKFETSESGTPESLASVLDYRSDYEANVSNHNSIDEDKKSVSSLGQTPIVSVYEEEEEEGGIVVGWVSASSDWKDRVQGKFGSFPNYRLQISCVDNIRKKWNWCKHKNAMRNVKLIRQQKEEKKTTFNNILNFGKQLDAKQSLLRSKLHSTTSKLVEEQTALNNIKACWGSTLHLVQDMLRRINEQIITLLRRRPPPEPPPQSLPLPYSKCVELHSIQYHCSITLCRMKNSVFFFPPDKCEVGSLRYIEDDMVLVGQRHGEGGSHGSQGGRLNLHTEIPKLDLEDKVDFKGRALIHTLTPHLSPTRSSAVKNGIRGCSGSTYEL